LWLLLNKLTSAAAISLYICLRPALPLRTVRVEYSKALLHANNANISLMHFVKYFWNIRTLFATAHNACIIHVCICIVSLRQFSQLQRTLAKMLALFLFFKINFLRVVIFELYFSHARLRVFVVRGLLKSILLCNHTE